MKIKAIILFFAGILIINLPSCKKNSLSNVEIKSSKDTLSYYMGLLTGLTMSYESEYIEPLAYAKGIQDVFDGKIPNNAMALEQYITERQMIIDAEVNKKNDAENAVFAEKNKKFLENNKKKDGVITTPSGLQYIIINTGTGSKPSSNDNVTIKYTLMNINEEVLSEGDELTANLNELIEGLSEGIQLMPKGSKYRFFVPAELGYLNGSGPIPPNSTIIFDIELLEINK